MNVLDISPKIILSNKYSLIIFIIIAYVYNIIIHRSKIITIIMIFVLLYFYYLYDIRGKLSDTNFRNPDEIKLNYLDNIINKDIKIHSNNNFFVDNTGLYTVYNKPTTFVFLPRDKLFESVLYNLRSIRRYDHADYYKLVVLMEKFLKIYYNLIIDRYEPRYLDHAIDIRKEILNLMYNFHVDAPLRETKHGHPLTKIIKQSIELVQAYTYKKIKYLGNKFPEQKHKIKNPHAISQYDLTDNYQIIV